MTITVGAPRAKTTPTGRIVIRLLLVAVGACAALSLVSLLLYLNRTTDDSEYRLWYGFLDKRWLVALY